MSHLQGSHECGQLAATLARMEAFDSGVTNAHRVIHGAADGWEGWSVDRFGGWLLSQSEGPLNRRRRAFLETLLERGEGLHGAYHKQLNRKVRESSPEQASPRRALGEAAPDEFEVLENGARYAIRFGEGYSVGLFLDQRENRRRLLTNDREVDPRLPEALPNGAEVLNTFSYTCAFSVCAGLAGARATSLDLSRKYLDWGRRNFELNGMRPDDHDFIYGDAFDWMKRLANKGRLFDLVILDPPTFSKSRKQGVFQTERNYGDLVRRALPLLRTGGVLFASCNTIRLPEAQFVDSVREAFTKCGRGWDRVFTPSQTPDFPVSPEAPAYLKQLWARAE